MSIRKEVTRNIRILSLLTLSFVLGIFAAEAVGTLMDRASHRADDAAAPPPAAIQADPAFNAAP